MTVTTWLIRYGHVLGGAVWVGGYALLALVIVPLLERERSATLGRMAIAAVRVLTYAGTLTLGFGIALITRTRGFGSLFGGEWGALVIASFVTAVALLGIGDGALRPALRRLAAGQEDGGTARRWALTGFALTVLAIGMMTRAYYAGS
jgi:putative copper export protein